MPFEIKDVTDADFPEVIEAMWDTYENPLQHLYRIFCPLNATGSADRQAAIEESTQRFRSWDASDPTSYWQKVVDTDKGNKVVGAALWKIYETNPYPVNHFDAYWHPEGGQRDFATQVYWQHEAARERMAQRPHMYLGIIFTVPEYQGKGVGKKILEWGIKRAAELDVEMWLDAWQYGLPVYERFGFTVVDHHRLKPESEKPDDAWKACENEWTDLEEWTMWRPKDGPYVEGKSVKPWEMQ